MKSYKILVLSLLVGGTLSAQSIEDAIKKTENERFDLASGIYKKLIANDASNGDNYFYYGESLLKDEKLDSAKLIWEQGIQQAPENALNYVGLAKYQWFTKDTVNANLNIDKAMDITKRKYHPQKTEVLRQTATIFIETPENKKLDYAISLVDKAIELDEPKNINNYIIKGDALDTKTPENGGPAINTYNIALEINPNSTRAILRKAYLYQRAKNYKLANEMYKQAQSKDPNFAPAYRKNAELYMMFNQADAAIENWLKYINLNNTLEAHYMYATALFQGAKYCEAIKELDYLNQNNFDNFYIKRMYAYSFVDCDEFESNVAAEKGLNYLSKFFEAAPEDKVFASDYRCKAMLLQKEGKDSLAIIELEKAISMDEKTAPDFLGDLANIYLSKKNYEKVAETYNRKANGDFNTLSVAEVYNFAKAYYFGTKDFKMADSCFANLAERSPSYIPAYLWRGRCNFNLDENKDLWLAFPHYSKLMEVVGENYTVPANKSSVIEASKYLGDYFVNNSEFKDLEMAKKYWSIVLELDPEDNQAKIFMEANQ